MGVLDGKVTVITGSSHGLGFAIAEVFAREGAACGQNQCQCPLKKLSGWPRMQLIRKLV